MDGYAVFVAIFYSRISLLINKVFPSLARSLDHVKLTISFHHTSLIIAKYVYRNVGVRITLSKEKKNVF